MLRHVADASKGAAKQVLTQLSHFSQPGDKLHGFTFLRSKGVPELELTALHLQHDRTGADYLHIARDDSNNVFSIGFKTNPPDDTGVPHILEHTTLCGSEKYPIRDPFFKMLPRSLSNFMNALTASDHTYYPFATTNKQDFRNLMSVYLDATLHPLLKKTDFMQEGWRIGPENPTLVAGHGNARPEDRKLVFKGVVYNEMKGQMSDGEYLYCTRFQDHMYPDIHNSGGDPQKITDLTYEQLKQFHAEHYHPSNAKILTYGDMPLADHLREVDARLAVFHKANADGENKRPIDLSRGPREVTVVGPMDPLADAEKQYKTSVAWTTGDTSDVVKSFGLSILSSLLMDGYGSPLYRGLIEMGLGTGFSPNAGYDNQGATGIFSIGLSGVQAADVKKVKPRIQKILEDCRQKGFDKSKIDGYMHQLEIQLKHKTANFGMDLVHRVKSNWFSGVDPFDSLAHNETVASFQANMAKGQYLESLLDKYLLKQKALTFTMKPSATYGAELVEEEIERLAAKIEQASSKAGSKAEAHKLFEQCELKLRQEQGKTTTEDLSCLPTVYVKDIPRQKERVVVRDEVAYGTTIQWREAPTNGLTYFRAINPSFGLSDEFRTLMPLFTASLMRLGTKDMTMEQLEDLIKLKTGDVSIGYHCTSSPTNFRHKASEGITLSGYALDRNVPVMLELFQKLIMETNFDGPEAAKRIRQLLEASADGVVNDIASSGHAYAMRAAESKLSRSGSLKEQIHGLRQVDRITSLAGRPPRDRYEDVISIFKEIQEFALSGPVLRTAITCGSDSVSANSSALSKFMSGRDRTGPDSDTFQILPKIPDPFKKEFYDLPFQVYYGALAFPTVSYNHADSAPLQVLAQLLTHKHLHHEIREKGGAYGGGAYMRGLDGFFGMYSYRDPSPKNTLAIMRDCGHWATNKEWSHQDLEEAKISVFQSVDAPKSVSTEGMDRFVYGITDDMKQQRREQLLDVTKDQIREVAQKYIVDQVPKGEWKLAILGERKDWDWVDHSWQVKSMDLHKTTDAPVV